MPKAKSQQISLDDARYYHCVSRCVRRAFLCGQDPYTGQSYEHRREWVQEPLLSLAQVFAVEVIAFAVMINHTHVVLYVNDYSPDPARSEHIKMSINIASTAHSWPLNGQYRATTLYKAAGPPSLGQIGLLIHPRTQTSQ